MFDILGYYDDTDYDTEHDTGDYTNDVPGDDADDGGRGNLYIIDDQGLMIKAQGSRLKDQGLD